MVCFVLSNLVLSPTLGTQCMLSKFLLPDSTHQTSEEGAWYLFCRCSLLDALPPNYGQILSFSISQEIPAGYLRSEWLRVRVCVNWYSRIRLRLWGRGPPCMVPHCSCSTVRLWLGDSLKALQVILIAARMQGPITMVLSVLPRRVASASSGYMLECMLAWCRLTKDKTWGLWGLYRPAGDCVSKPVIKARRCSLWDSSPAWEDEAGSLPSAQSLRHRMETAGAAAAPGYMSLFSCSKNCYICTCNC